MQRHYIHIGWSTLLEFFRNGLVEGDHQSFLTFWQILEAFYDSRSLTRSCSGNNYSMPFTTIDVSENIFLVFRPISLRSGNVDMGIVRFFRRKLADFFVCHINPFLEMIH